MISAEVIRFVVVGVINTATYYGLYLLFHPWMPYLVAHVLAFTISMIGSFFLNTYWTYRSRPTWRKFLLFPLSNATNFIITTVGIYLLVEVAGMNSRYAPLVAAAAAVPVTFVVMRRILADRTHSAGAGVERVRGDWERYGEEDPFYGVLTAPDKRGGAWDVEEFFTTGQQFVDGLLPVLDQHLPGLAKDAALDFGCGVGRLTQPLGDRFVSVVGVDVSAAMLDHARAHNHRANVAFVHNPASDLSQFPDASFDFVLSYIVLQHLPRDLIRGYLAEFARVLRPGGGAFFSLPAKPALTRRGLVYRLVPQELLTTLLRRRRGAAMRMSHIARPRLERLLTELGLAPVAVLPSTSVGPDWTAYDYVVRRQKEQSPADGA